MFKTFACGTIATDAVATDAGPDDYKISFTLAVYSTRRDDQAAEPIAVSFYSKHKDIIQRLRAGRILTVEGHPSARIVRGENGRKAVIELRLTGYELLEQQPLSSSPSNT